MELRGDLPITLNTSFTSPFDIPPLRGLKEAYFRQHELDREHDIHSPELYAVWTSKAYILAEGLANARAKGKKYDYAFWSDAGSLRDDHTCRQWPNPHRIDAIFKQGAILSGTPADELIFSPVWGLPKSSMGN